MSFHDVSHKHYRGPDLEMLLERLAVLYEETFASLSGISGHFRLGGRSSEEEEAMVSTQKRLESEVDGISEFADADRLQHARRS